MRTGGALIAPYAPSRSAKGGPFAVYCGNAVAHALSSTRVQPAGAGHARSAIRHAEERPCATAGAAQGPYPRLDRTPVSAYLSGRPGTSRSSTRDGPGTTARRVTLFALPNLWMVRKRMLNMGAQT